MNETIKAALLDVRAAAMLELKERQIAVQNAQRRVSAAECFVPQAEQRLADLEAFLRDNGVNLAEEDRKPGGANEWMPLTDEPDVMAGLARALDDA